MTMTEDRIIAEAERLAELEFPRTTVNPNFAKAVIAHYNALKATQPEQDPALVKALDVALEIHHAQEFVWSNGEEVQKAAARVIMTHYPAPSAWAVDWAKGPHPRHSAQAQAAADYILAMSGEKQ